MVVLLGVRPRPRLMTTAIYKFVMETRGTAVDLPADCWLRQPIQLLSSLMEVIVTFSMWGIWDIIQERDQRPPQRTLNLLGNYITHTFLSINSLEYDIWMIWIKNWLLKCAFCEKLRFWKRDMCEKIDFEKWNICEKVVAVLIVCGRCRYVTLANAHAKKI